MPATVFILGREPALSIAELEAWLPSLGATAVDIHAQAVLVRHEHPLAITTLNRLGGSLKQVQVIEHWPRQDDWLSTVQAASSAKFIQSQFPTGRIEYGLSVYGTSISERQAIQQHFLKLKPELKQLDRPVRMVTSHEPQLSAVSVKRNNLLKQGKEFVVVVGQTTVSLGITVAVQDYRAYSIRDYGRPAADPKSGMLPPKVAQIMLNIARVQPDDILLDPFCGSGTILQEAAWFGVNNIHGCDNDRQAVQRAQENIRWLMKEYPEIKTSVEISLGDARSVNIHPTVIVTEPYLGKPLHGNESRGWLVNQAEELQQLYLQAMGQWAKIIKPAGHLVMIIPEFKFAQEKIIIDLVPAAARLGWTAQPLLSEFGLAALSVVDPTEVEYGRPDAKLRRQIRKWRLNKD